jgi:activator of 2-hydroxyglutaryl-CoA dehydratase
MIPNQEMELSVEDTLQVLRTIENLEEMDDVQNVYSNLKIPKKPWLLWSLSRNMLVIGIDPGTATTGYGIIEENSKNEIRAVEFGVVSTAAGLPAEIRLLEINQKINEIILLHRPDCGAVEKLFFQRNVTTAIAVGKRAGDITFAGSGRSESE